MSFVASGRIAVVSPHLDDGVLSLGAAIARWSRSGAGVCIVTVFANDPESDAPPSEWDAACGFTSTADAATGRRREDERACEVVGAEPVWLSFPDSEHGDPTSDDELRRAVGEALLGIETMLIPGYPLAHQDHARLTRALLADPPPNMRIGLYVEQPYAAWRHLGRGRRVWAAPGLTPRRALRNAGAMVLRTRSGRRLQRPATPELVTEAVRGTPSWTAARSGLRDRVAKYRALREYASQFAGFGPATQAMIAVYELGWGGEGVAAIDGAPAPG